MNSLIQCRSIIFIIFFLDKSCNGVTISGSILHNQLNQQSSLPVESHYPEETIKAQQAKDLEVLLDLYEKQSSSSVENDNFERGHEMEQLDQDISTGIGVEQEKRRKRQTSWGYTTSLYPKLPTQPPYANNSPSGPHNTPWQPTTTYNNQSWPGYSYNASSANYYNQINNSRPNPNQYYHQYPNQPNQYPSKYPYNQPSYRPPYANNVTNLKPQGNSHPTNVQHYGQNTNYSYNPSQRPSTYPTSRPNVEYANTNKYPVIFQNTTTQKSPIYNPSQKPYYPNYNPLENTLFHNAPQNRSSNNASAYPYQPQNPYNRPGQGITNTTFSYPYPSGQPVPSNNPYSGANAQYNQYNGYPQPNNSPYSHAPSYNDPTPRPYNVSYNNGPYYNNNSSRPNYPQYPTNHSNGIGPNYPSTNNQFSSNTPYPGYQITNGTNAYNFGNTYNPRIPSQPPYNGASERNYFYYPQNPNNTQEDPTRIPPNRFSY